MHLMHMRKTAQNAPQMQPSQMFWGSWQDKRSRKAARAGDSSCSHVACKGK